MPVGATTIGPVDPELRDRLADYRDNRGHPHYNAALAELLEVSDRQDLCTDGDK